jgi:aminoglycoside phosphotransferase (APT) family kinase protein
LEDVKEASLVDFDLWPGNIYLRRDGNRYVIEGIIDFERALWGDCMAEFPPAFMLIRNLHKEERFWNTYKVMSGLDRELTKEEDVRLAFYSLCIFTIMTIETFRYGFLYGQIQKAYSKRMVMKYLRILERA